MDTSDVQSGESHRSQQPKTVQGRPLWYYLCWIVGILCGLVTLIRLILFRLWPVIADLFIVRHSYWPLFTLIFGLGCSVLAIGLWSRRSGLLLDPHSASWLTALMFFLPQNSSSIFSQTPPPANPKTVLPLPSNDVEAARAIADIGDQVPVEAQNTVPLSARKSSSEAQVITQKIGTGASTRLPNAMPLESNSSNPYKTQDNPPQNPILEPVITHSGISPVIVGIRTFAVPRDGTNLMLSADKWADSVDRGRYALADGVSRSFLPGPWAQFVADQFVNHPGLPGEVLSQNDFERWLNKSSKEWHHWVEKDWYPEAVAESGQTNWDREINRGASTTFIGCSFSWDRLRQYGKTEVFVTAVGDAVFFRVSRDLRRPQRWTHTSFRLKRSEDFGLGTETLASPERRIQQDWGKVHQQQFSVTPADVIVLATDALAQCIMRMGEKELNPWPELFALPDNEAFKEFVDYYRHTGAMQIDDTTLMMIGLSHRSDSKIK